MSYIIICIYTVSLFWASLGPQMSRQKRQVLASDAATGDQMLDPQAIRLLEFRCLVTPQKNAGNGGKAWQTWTYLWNSMK